MFVILRLLFAPLVALLFAGSAAAHEYYLMPEKFIVSADEEIAVRHHLGQRFAGNEMPYISSWNIRSELWRDGTLVSQLRGTDGDRPALNLPPQEPGLISVVHQSNISKYAPGDWAKFAAYLSKEGLGSKIAEHRARGLDETDPTEAYSRYAKTLITVGQGGGQDAATGLTIEFIALANPLTHPLDQPFPVQLQYLGKPLAGRAVKIFAGLDTEHIGYVETDDEGKALIPANGKGPYLLNAIEMVEPISDDPIAKSAQWESFWASLTFQRGR